MLTVKIRAALKRTAAIPSDSDSQDPSSSFYENSQVRIKKTNPNKLILENQQPSSFYLVLFLCCWQQSSGNSCSLLSKNLTLDYELPVSGDGEDYFLSLFGDSKKLTSPSGYAKDPYKHFSTILEEVGKSTSSSLGDIKIAEVNVKGLFVKLLNSSLDKEVAIGNHILQQNVKGKAVSLYRFLPNVIMRAGSTVTVWAAAPKGKHQPPSDFLWKEQSTFRASPDCTTILCKPSGEAIAWYTPIHWKQVWEKLETDTEFNRSSVVSPAFRRHMFLWTASSNTVNKENQDRTKEDASKCDQKQVRLLKREKEMPPSLFPDHSPWCSSPCAPAHPYCPLIRPCDRCISTRSSSSRQPRSQASRADPAPANCDSPKTSKIYGACDGPELKRGYSFIVVRFIPDDITFDDEPKDVASEADLSGYKPKYFPSAAMGASVVEVTWEETDRERITTLNRKFKKEELLDMDFQAYLASSSEGEEVVEEEIQGYD
ncbi:Intermediate filament tail domain-containing protein 1 [Fukomys damarensis]|uniref:Intermediate filament tail domain-containing protein 1 n=1 Tax=Fukomys damarensis TaxID=885580 RepID=A0A091E1X0_FUKDA|nr:Intermediate filament tail domain-containing protein 1 [Fukomys damarensis]